MKKYRITTNRGKFRIEHFVDKSLLGPQSAWYPLTIQGVDWFSTRENADNALQALMEREAINAGPWEPV